MKGCFILQRRFAYIGHYIALSLKKNYGVNEFCAYAFLRSSYNFLTQQKDINYSTLLFDDNIYNKYKEEQLDLNYLRYIEKEFGIPNLWPYLTVDRILMHNQLIRDYPYNKSHFTHRQLLLLLQAYTKTILEMLKKEKPDFIFYSVAGSIGSLLLCQIAKKFNIKTLAVLPTGIKGRCVISELYDRYTGVEKIFNEGSSENFRSLAKKYIADFRQKPESYISQIDEALKQTGRRRQLKFLRPKHFWQSLEWFGQMIKLYWQQKKFKDYSSTIHPWYYLVDRIKRKTRNLRGLNDLYDAFNPKEDFVFFPLHYEPEVSLLFQAPFYADQIYVIRQIAKSLPIHYKLYIKEHPSMIDYRPRSFYKELKKIHNVKLINPAISSFSIIPQAKLITVITGTTGWEALLFKKPVISFGNQFYNALSMVKKCTEIERLPYLIKEQLENFVYKEEELISFISAIFQDSITLDLEHVWHNENNADKIKKELEPLADLIAAKLNLKPSTMVNDN